jgi:hypothetical protein
MKEALSSSETSVLTRATRRNIPEDAILHSDRREDLKSYNLTFSPMSDIKVCVCPLYKYTSTHPNFRRSNRSKICGLERGLALPQSLLSLSIILHGDWSVLRDCEAGSFVMGWVDANGKSVRLPPPALENVLVWDIRMFFKLINVTVLASYVEPKDKKWIQFTDTWSFHDCDYEERRLLGYNTPVRTSQETY